MPTRPTPYGAYNFQVDFPGNPPPNDALGGFSDVTGLGMEVPAIEYRNGNDKENQVRKTSGLAKVSDVTCKRGIMGLTNFGAWIAEIRADPDKTRDLRITLNDEQGNPVLRWKLFKARPTKWTGPAFAGKGGSDVAMEELVVAAEGLEFEPV